MKVLSIEQMNKLKDLGVDVTPKDECLIYQNVMGIDILAFTDKFQNEEVKAFTLQDVIELLPAEIQTNDSNYYLVITKIAKDSYISAYDIDLQDGSMNEVQFFSNDVLDAAYLMLLWVIENGHLKTNTDENN